jgi:hypothetical protein
MGRFALVLALFVASLSAACAAAWEGGSVAPHRGQGQVVGRLRMVGGPAPWAPRPQPGLVVRIRSGSHVVRAVRAGAGGRFRFRLPAGRYTLTMGANTPIKPRSLRMRAGATVRVVLTIEAR